MNDAQDIPMIRMQDLQKGFGRKQVLRGIDLELGKGESVVIIGGSGTGKSVTLKCVLGLAVHAIAFIGAGFQHESIDSAQRPSV